MESKLQNYLDSQGHKRDNLSISAIGYLVCVCVVGHCCRAFWSLVQGKAKTSQQVFLPVKCQVEASAVPSVLAFLPLVIWQALTCPLALQTNLQKVQLVSERHFSAVDTH